MAATHPLDFERSARYDVRIWLAAAVGGLLGLSALSTLAQSGPLMIADAPLWMSLIFLVSGVGMAGLALVALVANTSRGCRVDPANGTLAWWQMRFPWQAHEQMQAIALADIDRILVDRSGDGISIALYDRHGTKREGFGELTLPGDYDIWLRTLNTQHPHIQIERK